MQSSSTLALRAGNEHNRSPLKKKKKVLVYVVIPVLASYLENGACDQLEFISHGQTGAFFFFLVEKQTINLPQPPLRPAGESLTLQRRIWSGADCLTFDL